MKLKKAIEILKHHNKWRRGETDCQEHSPKQIGEAIDRVIKKYMTWKD